MASTAFDERSVIRTLGLRVEERTFWVSRESLASFSPVFEAMLYKDFAESKQEIIELPGKKATDILEMLCTTFPTPKTKTKEINEQNVDAMLVLADEYQIEELRTKCDKFFFAQLRDCPKHSETVLSILKRAHQYSLWEAFRECAKICRAYNIHDMFPVMTEMRPAAIACILLYSKHNGYHEAADPTKQLGSGSWCTRCFDGLCRPLLVSCKWCSKLICPRCGVSGAEAQCERMKVDELVDKILASM